MDELTFCRRAKALVRECVRGWYEKTMGLPTLIKVVDTDRFSWIGCNEAEYLPGKNKEEKEDRMEHMQDIPERLYFGREQYYFQPLTPTACLIFARYELRTGEKSGMILAERQRATFLVRCEGERLRICHIHVSNPIREGRQLPVCPPGFPAGSGMALTERQNRVLYLLVRGEKYGDIAETLQIAPSTVRYYVTELCRKFHVKNRAQLVVAAERELLPEDGGGGVTAPRPANRLSGRFFCALFRKRYTDDSVISVLDGSMREPTGL